MYGDFAFSLSSKSVLRSYIGRELELTLFLKLTVLLKSIERVTLTAGYFQWRSNVLKYM